MLRQDDGTSPSPPPYWCIPGAWRGGSGTAEEIGTVPVRLSSDESPTPDSLVAVQGTVTLERARICRRPWARQGTTAWFQPRRNVNLLANYVDGRAAAHHSPLLTEYSLFLSEFTQHADCVRSSWTRALGGSTVHGQLVKTTVTEPATFDGPGGRSAARPSQGRLAERSKDPAGCNGEIELRDEDVGVIAVHINAA